jgi:DNA-binding transcriptional ArsR family regulator
MDEKTYKVIEVKSKEGILNEILIQCNACSSAISLVGFESLNEPLEQDPLEEELEKKPAKPLKGKTDKQILQLLADGSSLTLSEISETLGKKKKAVFKALRKLFEKEKIKSNPKERTYSLA